MRLFLVLFGALAISVGGNSIGAPSLSGFSFCNAKFENNNYGCVSGFAPLLDTSGRVVTINNVPQEDRVHGCKDKNLDSTGKPIRYMYWSTQPIRTTNITLRTADTLDTSTDAKTYIPGQIINIHIRVNQVRMKWRGLMLYAENSAGNKIGKFSSTDPDIYHTPWDAMNNNLVGLTSQAAGANKCQGVITHKYPETKPYHVVFQYTAPPAGSGPIVFRCLLKLGPANAGSFITPNMADLTLTEAATPAASTWSLLTTKIGKSCQNHCVNNSMGICNETALKNLATNFDTIVPTKMLCSLPYLCDTNGLSKSNITNNCYKQCSNPSSISYCNIASNDPELGSRMCICTVGASSGSSIGTGSGTTGGETSGNGASSVSNNDSNGTTAVPVFQIVLGGVLGLGLILVGVLVTLKLKYGAAKLNATTHTKL